MQTAFGQPLEREYNYFNLLRRPAVTYAQLMALSGSPTDVLTDPQAIEQVEISAKYQGYIDRQLDEVARTATQENTRLPIDFDYNEVRGLSKEVQQKLNQHKPETIGQASRIQGITPAAVGILLVWLKRQSMLEALSRSDAA